MDVNGAHLEIIKYIVLILHVNKQLILIIANYLYLIVFEAFVQLQMNIRYSNTIDINLLDSNISAHRAAESTEFMKIIGKT